MHGWQCPLSSTPPLGCRVNAGRRWAASPPDFAEKQNAVLEAYHRLGVKLECTCTPYYINRTSYGEHIAWSESSAVCYANSVIGARTNREGGPSALAAAIVGKTPYYGLHLWENRMPQVAFRVEADETLHAGHYGAIGYLAGKEAGNRVPFFYGLRPNRDQLKALGAAMAASGAVALYHVDGITPDSRVLQERGTDISALETITITGEEIEAIFEERTVDAVAIGCPHCSEEELEEIAGLLKGKQVTKPLYIFAARGVAQAHPNLVGTIEQSGGTSMGGHLYCCLARNGSLRHHYGQFRQGVCLCTEYVWRAGSSRFYRGMHCRCSG